MAVLRGARTGLLLVALSPAFAGRVLADDPAPALDPQVDTVVRQLTEYAQGFKSCRVDVASSMTLKNSGTNFAMSSTVLVAMERPDHLAFILKEGTMGTTVVCDGAHLYAYLPMTQSYTIQESPKDMDEIVPAASSEMGVSAELQVIASLFRSDANRALMEGVTATEYLGTEMLDGAKCHHLRFHQPGHDWDLWVETGKRPLVKRIVPDMSTAAMHVKDLPPMYQDAKIEQSTDFKNWSVDEDIPDDVFAIVLPEGARKVESLYDALGSRDQDAMIGQAAPAFELEFLDGAKMRLDDHKGKDVVVLDFWATWCGPCRLGMPVLAEIAGEFKDRGVVVYAIDMGEDADRIGKYLDKTKLKLTVAMDRDTSVGRLYQVSGIPRTVIIGRDGTIKAAHTGYRQDMKEMLSAELATILEGK